VPTLQEAKELTAPLEQLVRELKKELSDSKGDFDRLVEISDEIGAQADALAETFGNINQTLMARIQDFRANGQRSSSSRQRAAVSS
jgi:ABC-type transporter Mla subunit MlaD